VDGRTPLDAGPSATSGLTPPVLDFAALPARLRRELRADHVGETVAVRLYEGAIAGSRDAAVRRFATSHRAVEQRHLGLFDATVPPAHRSRLLPLLRAGGWLMGWLPAKAGAPAFYAVVAEVEHWVDGHYGAQIAVARRLGADDSLLALLDACRNDERHHSEDAARAGRVRPPLARLLAAVAVAGSRAGVALARWV